MKVVLNKGEVVVKESALIELLETKNSYKSELESLMETFSKYTLEKEIGSMKRMKDENEKLKAKLRQRDKDLEILKINLEALDKLYLETINKLKNKSFKREIEKISKKDLEIFDKVKTFKNNLDIKA